MKKYITIAGLVVAGTAFVGAETLNLDLPYGKVIGGAYNTATVANSTFPTTTTLSDWTSVLTETSTWYVQSGYQTNISEGSATDNATLLVVGGPAGKLSPSGAILFTVDSAYFKDVESDVTFSFNATLVGGNNNSNHSLTFGLISSAWNKSSSAYNTKTGDNLLTTDATKVEFTISKEEATSIAEAGGSASFVFSAISDEVHGSNRVISMSDFAFNGVSVIPEPSAFGLLAGLGALALVGARRRRR